MRTIRGRLILSLVLVMVFSVSVTIFLFSVYTNGMFKDQARTQLEIQLQKALEVLDGGEISDLDDTDLAIRFKNHLFDADYAVLNPHNRVIASSDASLIGKHLRAGVSGTTDTLSRHGEQWLYTVNDIDDKQLRLMLFTPLGALSGFHRKWIAIAAAALAASSLFIFMVGFFMIWNTTRPLKRLREAVSGYRPDRWSEALPTADSGSEIGKLIQTFHSMTDRIGRHHEHQTAFLHQVSHELRTPLMSIQGYAMAIKDQVVPQEQALNVICNESQRLIQMVGKLLELSRLESESEQWPVQMVDLREMAGNAAEIVSPLAGKDEVAIHVESEDSMWAEVPAEQLFLVMLNLLSNAARHAATQARIMISREENQWRITVDDDGPGVPEELRETVFSRFYKGNDGGLGLGLTICRQISERMGATLVCEVSEWGGARFRYEWSA
ncbi:HAMP domain-containing sensor histidine kinase [Cohnella soli]|uniref:histidine kinase n=1 Tax=Cohnella soli TaxID=425005 RepID=A0ABW0HWW6_9BACL